MATPVEQEENNIMELDFDIVYLSRALILGFGIVQVVIPVACADRRSYVSR